MPRAKKIVGVTGGIAAGKSEAAAMFQSFGADVLSADDIAGEQLVKGASGYKAIVAKYGKEVLDDRGNLKKPVIAKRIFSDAKSRRWLESVLHPLVLEEISRRIKSSSKKVIAVDVPLLFENNIGDWFDLTVCIYVRREDALKRALSRGWTEKEFERRSAAQLTPEVKAEMSDVVITNGATLSVLRRKVARLYRMMKP